MKQAIAAGVIALTISAVGISPAVAAPIQIDAHRMSTVTNALSTQQRADLAALPKPQQARTLAILDDPNFGDPSRAEQLMVKYPELNVFNTEGTAAALSVTQRSRYVQQNWSILGISYATIRTTISFRATEHQVDTILSCWNSSWNAVPGLRSISGHSYSQYNGYLGHATCKTDWVIQRLVGGTGSGTQGLKVDGYGVIIQRWSV